MFSHHLYLPEQPLLSHAEPQNSCLPDPQQKAPHHRREKTNHHGKSLKSSNSKNQGQFHVEREDFDTGGSLRYQAPAGGEERYQCIARSHQYSGVKGSDQAGDQHQVPDLHHPDLYCQKNLFPSGRKSSQENSFNYLGGTMYSPCANEGLGRHLSGAFWSGRGPVCRPRFWKFFLLVVVLLMMAQFSLNVLLYRNYDSLFYVNVTSTEALSSFESKVKWVSSKLPWSHSISEKPGGVAQSPDLDTNRIRKPLPDGQRTTPSTLKIDIDVKNLTGVEKVDPKNLTSTNEAINEEGKKINPLHSPLNDTKRRKSETSDTVNSEKLALKAAVEISSAGDEKKDTEQSKIPHVDAEVKTLVNVSSSGVGVEKKKVLLSKEKPLCPPVPPKLVGALKVLRTAPSLQEQEGSHPELEPGGRFRPAECRARHRVAIIIPYRDRIKHLSVFLYHLHPILQRQQIDYAIYVVEQAGNGKFNRAMIMNVGALEALKQYQYDCFIFHDVDLLPEDDRNLYTCPEQPRHMSVAIDSMHYRLPYNDIFGGVSAMTVEQFRTVNGFSNKFWGWGGEDDDMSNRIKYHGFYISRYPANIGRYTMLSHRKDDPNPRRYQYLYDGKKRFKTDGVNSAKYRALDVQLRRLYTWVYVDLYPS
ncbi:uncharacterized protein LOC121867457 [Homarus americanus]|uniref:uncharacterized protein LOC121867456 n=1 Tax=Homarus americanus TaxID=6706 RepID=UPI001C4968FF|nr:uncharacterized protein LOC121867456 [Homarus americanus]XP_042223302.1 uncharacterized protein LOC121867457 [Homarus americanus]